MEFATEDTLRDSIYPLVDGVTEEQFEAAIEEARAEGQPLPQK
jgi:hypothetical protein